MDLYAKNFDGKVWGYHSAFQNGLIHDFIMSSYLTMVENVKVGGLKFRNFYIFHTIPLFGKIAIATVLEGFRSLYLAPPF